MAEKIVWYSLEEGEVLEKLETSDEGLNVEEARSRLSAYGPNELIEKKRITPFENT